MAANPQQPSTSARTPQPSVSVSTTFTIWCSRVTTKFCRKRAMRASAHDAPAPLAALSASIISSFGAPRSKRSTSRASAAGAAAAVLRGMAATAASAAAAPERWRNSRRFVIRSHAPGVGKSIRDSRRVAVAGRMGNRATERTPPALSLAFAAGEFSTHESSREGVTRGGVRAQGRPGADDPGQRSAASASAGPASAAPMFTFTSGMTGRADDASRRSRSAMNSPARSRRSDRSSPT